MPEIAGKIAREFIAAINARDVNAIVALMAAKFIMIDSLGNKSTREQMPSAWRQYFGMVPDYWIEIEDEIAEGQRAVFFGQAGGTLAPGGEPRPQNKWQTECVWRATVVNGKLTEWRIWADNEPIREKMRAASSG